LVDLAQIRKKKAESRRQKAEVPPPEASETRQPSNPATEEPPRDPETPRPRDSAKLERFMSEAGKKREGFVHAAAEAAAGNEIEVLTFALAGEQYAVGIGHIVEIVRPRAATRVPNAGANVVGIISLRGLIVTIVDVRARLHHPPAAAPANDARIIVVDHGGETLGFQVDRVLRVVKLDAGAVEAQPVVHSSEQTESIRGVFQHAGALTILLDLDKLLA
jgi:purine-binding chemotaxis protein CheW